MIVVLAICIGWPCVALALAIGIGRAIRDVPQPARCPDTVPAWMVAEVRK